LYNRVRAEYLLPEVGQAMKPLVAPHLTFHSPDNGHRPDAGASEGWMHLTASNKKGKDKPFEAIFPLELMLTQQPEVPWVRFVSKAIDRMEPDKALTQRGQHEDRGVLSFVLPSLACSLGLSVDFVRPGDQTHDDLAALGVAWFDNAPYQIRVSAHARPPQPCVQRPRGRLHDVVAHLPASHRAHLEWTPNGWCIGARASAWPRAVW
jgi:hypothetical protein